MLRTKIWMAAALLATVGASNAMAAHGGHGHGAGSHHGSCEWRGHSWAGTIVIDGCRTTIRGGEDVAWQIARAFNKAGYRACVERGRVSVEYGSCRPLVRWYADGYRAVFRWGYGCGTVAVYQNACGSCTPGRWDRGRDYRRDRHGGRDYRRGWPSRRWSRDSCG